MPNNVARPFDNDEREKQKQFHSEQTGDGRTKLTLNKPRRISKGNHKSRHKTKAPQFIGHEADLQRAKEENLDIKIAFDQTSDVTAKLLDFDRFAIKIQPMRGIDEGPCWVYKHAIEVIRVPE